MQFSPSIKEKEVVRIVQFEESNPSKILGAKLIKIGGDSILSVRAYLPRAKKAWIEFISGEKKELTLLDERGFYEAQIKGKPSSHYVISFVDDTGYIETREDPYFFRSFLSDYDIYLISEGTHKRSYEKLGAHPVERNGVRGVQFAVWAPNARSVCVIGNFNHWNVGEHPMDSLGPSGIWELFVPRIGTSEVYKFAIKSNVDSKVIEKIDPYAFQTELRPRTAAVVSDLGEYEWHDEDWIRSARNPCDGPISIYEVHLGSWKKKKIKEEEHYLSYEEIAGDLIPYVKNMGFTHVEFLPVMEHPLDDSWGYQVINYYAPTSRFGTPLDFMGLIDRCHQAGIGVILDWVPAHFPKDDYGLALFDGTHLYDHADPKMGEHPDWGTLIFNYERNEVRTFLLSSAIFWLEKYHADGLRLDAVASMIHLDYSRKEGEWVPNKFGGSENLGAISFLRELNDSIHSFSPRCITAAEESTPYPGVTKPTKSGGLGFDLKWNMGWMHDTLDYFSQDPVHRKYHQDKLTFSLLYAFSERFILVLSHDEVVYGKRSMFGKMPGDDWQKFANLRLCYGYMFTHPGKKLLFMGCEFGQWNEWNFRTGLDWALLEEPMNRKLAYYMSDLNRLYSSEKSLHEIDYSYEGFEWVDFKDVDQSVISFVRKGKDSWDWVLVVCNMTPVPRYNYRVGVPEEGEYDEILNSDATEYGGSGVGNLGRISSEKVSWNSKPHSLLITLPPLAILMFRHAQS